MNSGIHQDEEFCQFDVGLLFSSLMYFMRSSVVYVLVGVVHSWVFGRFMNLLFESAINIPLGLLACVVL